MMPVLSLEIKLCSEKICAISTGEVPSDCAGPEELTLTSLGDEDDTLEILSPLVPKEYEFPKILEIRNESVFFTDIPRDLGLNIKTGPGVAVLKYTPSSEVRWWWHGKNLGIPTFEGRTIRAEFKGTSVLKCSYSTVLSIPGMFVEVCIQPEEVLNPALCMVTDSSFTYEILGHPLVGTYFDLGAYWIKITALNPSICNFEGAKILGEFVGLIASYVPTFGGEVPVPTEIEVTEEIVVFKNTDKAVLEYTPKDVEAIEWFWYGPNLGSPIFDGKNIKVGRNGRSTLKCSYIGVIPAESALDIDATFDNTNSPQVQGDPLVVPGERISLWWKVGPNGDYQEVAHDYIHTCLLTGGTVTAVSGDYGDSDVSYSVRIEGTVYIGVKSTDFREYVVGEWVYILKPDEVGASSCGRAEGCEGSDYSGGGVIVPIHITGVNA